MTFLIPADCYRRRLRSWKPVMLALPYTARKCERYQLRMRTMSHSKHTKLKNTKIYSKGVLANHTKISTNENFPLYSNTPRMHSRAIQSKQTTYTPILRKFLNNAHHGYSHFSRSAWAENIANLWLPYTNMGKL